MSESLYFYRSFLRGNLDNEDEYSRDISVDYSVGIRENENRSDGMTFRESIKKC